MVEFINKNMTKKLIICSLKLCQTQESMTYFDDYNYIY